MRLIDADRAEEILSGQDEQDLYLPVHFKELVLDECPTVDAEPVRRGHWIQEADRRGWRTRLFYHCSRCGRVEDIRDDEDPAKVMPYCHCGAKMDEEV